MSYGVFFEIILISAFAGILRGAFGYLKHTNEEFDKMKFLKTVFCSCIYGIFIGLGISNVDVGEQGLDLATKMLIFTTVFTATIIIDEGRKFFEGKQTQK